MTSSHPDADEDTRNDELDLVRQALDYVPEDVLQELADEEDHALLASIDERLDRIVIEEVEDETPTWAPSGDDDATPREASRTDDSDDASAEDEGDALEAGDPSEEPQQDRPVKVVLTEDQDETLDDEPSPEEGPNAPNIEVVLAETPTPQEGPSEEEGEEGSAEDPEGEIARQALAQASQRPEGEPSHPPWPEEGNGHDPEIETGESPFDVLNEFTVVAPATGSIEGNWVLAIEPETVQAPEPEPEDDLGLDEFDESLGDEDPFAEEEDAEGIQEEDQMEDLFGDELFDEDEDAEGDQTEEELLAEAEPEQTVEEDEEFWESLLEDGEPHEEASEPESETTEDWLEEGWEEPEAGQEATEEETFEDLWADTEDDEPEQPMTFEAAAAEPEDELLFEEVEFELAEADEPEPTKESEDLEEAEGDEEDLQEASAEVEWPTPPSEEPGPEPATTQAVEDQPPSREGYTHGPYTLYHKVVETGAGEPRDLYFFARNPPEDASPTELPDGYEVGVNDRTGVPFVREEQ